MTARNIDCRLASSPDRRSPRRILDRARMALALSACIAATGCVGVWHTPYTPAQATGQGSAFTVQTSSLIPSMFAHTPSAAEPVVTRERSTDANYDRFDIRFRPISVNASRPTQLASTLYLSRRPDTRDLVIVLPIWGSHGYPPRKLVRTLRRRSEGALDIIAMHGEEAIFQWRAMTEAKTETEFAALVEDGATRFLDTLVALRQLIDWSERFAPERISVVGFSMGALVGSIALAVDDRISGGVMMMGGAHPGRIFATCGRKVGRARNAALKRFGWTRARYRQIFEERFALADPVRYADRYDPERILIVDGAFDGCMRRKSRRALWRAMGRPERLSIFSTHAWSFLAFTPPALNFAGRRISDFLTSPDNRAEYARLTESRSADPIVSATSARRDIDAATSKRRTP